MMGKKNKNKKKNQRTDITTASNNEIIGLLDTSITELDIEFIDWFDGSITELEQKYNEVAGKLLVEVNSISVKLVELEHKIEQLKTEREDTREENSKKKEELDKTPTEITEQRDILKAELENKKKQAKKELWKTIQAKGVQLWEILLKKHWPIRVKDEIRMYFILFRDSLLTAIEQENSLFPKDSREILRIIIASLKPTKLVMEEGDLRDMHRSTLIKSIRDEDEGKSKGKGKSKGSRETAEPALDLTMVCNGLLEYFGITEQRNIGAPQFCITRVDWDTKGGIHFEGWAWAAVPLGVYRQDEFTEVYEIKMFRSKYPEMMEQLRMALLTHDFEIRNDFCGVGLKFTAEYSAEKALEHIENWFKICLFTAVTALWKEEWTEGNLMVGGQALVRKFETSWNEKGEPMVSVTIFNDGLLDALTTSTAKEHKMLQGLMLGLGWKRVEASGRLQNKASKQAESSTLKYTCTRPLWSLIHGLGCWMSKKQIEGLGYYLDPSSNYCNYVVELQQLKIKKIEEIGGIKEIKEIKIWNSEPQPNSLVYRPDNPNFSERNDVGLHYHVHVYQGHVRDGAFEGGEGFPVNNDSSSAAPLWQGFKVYEL